MNPFSSLGLSTEIVDTLTQLGFEEPTEIQKQAIPKVMAGNDLLAIAQTGTGKTAAYALPTIERLKRYANQSTSPAMHPIRMLILVPTRELTEQIEEHISLFTKNLPLKHLVIFGGTNINNQIKQLREGVEIVVATVGRLKDLIAQQVIQLNKVEILVLDEADKMFDIGFFEDIREIFLMLPSKKQTVLFSATFSKQIELLANEFLHNPQRIEITKKNTITNTVEQHFLGVDQSQKRSLLLDLIVDLKIKQVIIFCNTKNNVDHVTQFLKQNRISALSMHGGKTQLLRTNALNQFKQGEILALVCTDVAARGLDITALPFVINYDLPDHAEDYVHRIGRTGRAGRNGISISLVSQASLSHFDKIIELTNQESELEFINNYDPTWHDKQKNILNHPPVKSTINKAENITSSSTTTHKTFTGFTQPLISSYSNKKIGHYRVQRRHLQKEECALLLPQYGINN